MTIYKLYNFIQKSSCGVSSSHTQSAVELIPVARLYQERGNSGLSDVTREGLGTELRPPAKQPTAAPIWS